MAGLVRFRGIRQIVNRLIQRRSVGTSNAKKSDTTTANLPSATSSLVTSSVECKPAKKNWVTYGFSNVSEEHDRHLMHLSFFVIVSMGVTLGAYLLMYMPDFKNLDWSHREGYIELRRREELGLPHVDINLIDPAKVKLPTDEELGDTEIII